MLNAAFLAPISSAFSLLQFRFYVRRRAGTLAGLREKSEMYPRFASPLTTALTLLFATQAFAAAPNEGVVVTATRFGEADPSIPANISIITRQDIGKLPTQSLPDILATRAGVLVSQLGGGSMGRNSTIDLRGFGATATSNTLVLVDGQRMNPVDSGTIIWSSIPVESIERIEIIRGSGTVLYGDGATGGVINIVTNKSGRRAASISGTLGSNGRRESDIRWADGNERAYYNVVVNYATEDGYRHNAQEDQVAASGRVGLLLDRGEIFTDFAVYKESEGLPGSIFSASYANDERKTRFPDNTEKRDGYRLRPGIKYQFNSDFSFEAELGIEHQRLRSNIVSSSYFSDRDRDTVSFTPRFRWHHGIGALPSVTVVGADVYDSDVSSANRGAANQGADQMSSALYVQNMTNVAPRLSLTTGARMQRVKQSASQDAYAPWFSPAFSGQSTHTQSAFDVGLAYAAEEWRVYGKTGTTFRFANTDELFGFDTVLEVPTFAGDIKPQHGRINEIGGSTKIGSIDFRTSLYQLNLTDEIGYDGGAGANVNFSPTRRKGAEVEAAWKAVESLEIRLSYAYTDATFRNGAYSGKSIPLVPKNQASIGLTWNVSEISRYSGVLRYVGERRFGSDFDNSKGMLSSYTTLDLQANWALKPWQITAKVLNALDKKYAPFAGYSSLHNDTYYYPANGRGFFLSGRYDF